MQKLERSYLRRKNDRERGVDPTGCVYALSASQDRPLAEDRRWWCWLREEVLLWHLERMPDLFDAAELAGIEPARSGLASLRASLERGSTTISLTQAEVSGKGFGARLIK